MAKRQYIHKKGRMIPTGHGSIMDKLDHDSAGHPMSSYKTKKKKSIFDI